MGYEADNEMDGCIKRTSLLDPHVLYITTWKKWSTSSSICIPPLQVQIAKDNLAMCAEADEMNSDSSSHELLFIHPYRT